MTDILFKEETYKIMGAAFDVYNEHGSGFPEPIYQESMEMEFGDRNIPYAPLPIMKAHYKGRELKKRFIPDFLAYDKIIVELKIVEALTDKERKQLYYYLKTSGLRLGLLINFGCPHKLEWERIYWSKENNGVDYGF